MKYLFFDIECANCYEGIGKVCEFGYILTNDKFEILEQDSIKINPAASFDKKGFAMRGIKLEMPFEYYFTQPKFYNFYSRIKALLQAKNQIVVGHGTRNDAKFLIDECNRYKLPFINFEFCDTCELAKLIYNREKNLKLGELYADYCGAEDSTQNHRSLEDAYMTLCLAKAYSEHLNMPFNQVLTNYTLATGESFSGRVINAGIPDLNYSRNNKLNKKNVRLVNTFINDEMAYNPEKTYVLSSEIEDNFYGLMVILNRLKELNKGFSLSMSRYVTYVMNDGANKKLDEYLKYLESKERAVEFKTISFKDFLDEIGLKEADLNVSESVIDELIGNMKRNRSWYDHFKKTHTVFDKINSSLNENEFECSTDFPVIAYVANVTSVTNGETEVRKAYLFYDSVMDAFFYHLHPYRVNPLKNSYLNNKLFKKAREKSIFRVNIELARQMPLSKFSRIQEISIENEIPYITSYKFAGKFINDRLVLEFTDKILADDDFKTSTKFDLRNCSVDIEKALREYYDAEVFSTALTTMSKFKFGYKDKSFIAPKIVNKKYILGDEIKLPKAYYALTEEERQEKCYLPSLIEFQTDIFKQKVKLPVLIKRSDR